MGHTPYGYRIENGNAVIEPKEAEAVVKMCEGYFGGLSLKAAAETAGIVATHCQAKRMMQNEKYLGTDYYPAILTKDVMDKVKAELEKTNNVDAAAYLGKVIAEKAIEKGIKDVVFDRGGFIYQGKIQALADAAREAGLNF